MDLITDYANWKFENFDTIDGLVKLNSDIIRRFPHVILVCDYYYDKVTNEGYSLSDVEETIFSSGFNYLFDHFETINLLLEKDFNSDIEELNKLSKTINLLLYTNDFQAELENSDPTNIKGAQDLNNFENKILKYIESRTNAPDEMFAILSDIATPLFADDYLGVNEILYNVAEQLGIAPDESDEDEIDFKY